MPIPTESGRRGLLSLPNLLSLVRVPLAAVPWLAPRNEALFFASLVVAAATDWADGFAARRRGGAQAGATGAWLDPLCDKVFVASVALLVFVTYDPPLWFVLAVMAREGLQVPLVLIYHLGFGGGRRVRFDFRASLLGKATTCAQFFAVGALVLGLSAAAPLAGVAAALGTGAAATYVRRFLRARRAQRSAPRVS